MVIQHSPTRCCLRDFEMAKKPFRSPIRVYVGSFTTEKRQSRGKGIEVYTVDPVEGRWTLVQRLEGLLNPSWLHLNRAGTTLYAGHGDADYISSYRVDPDSGRIAPLNRAKSGGSNVVSCRLDPSERFLVTANYNTGTVGVLPIGGDGRLGPPRQIVSLPGEPRAHHRAEQQESSHPHDVAFDPSGRFVLIPDKGLDRVHIFRFAGGKLKPTTQKYTLARDGSGPRHMLFHPTRPFAWVVNELDSTVVSYRWDRQRGRLTPFHVNFTLPGDFSGDNRGNEMAFDPASSTLYVANLLHDTFLKLRINANTGMPKELGWDSTRGHRTRIFCFHQASRLLFCAHWDSDDIVTFRVDARSGKLTPLRPKIATPSPVALALFHQAAPERR
jgi:6-phosphogluconolactonase